jgi:ABC-type multidrug transport system permease subunit
MQNDEAPEGDPVRRAMVPKGDSALTDRASAPSLGGRMENRSAPVISLGEWIITFIVLAIPLVNIIMLFVWGFSSGTNPSKQNFCRAALILYAICFVLFFLFGGMAFLGAMRGMPQGT